MDSRYEDAVIIEDSSEDSDILSRNEKSSAAQGRARKLDFQPNERMDNRTVTIPNFDVVYDWLLHSYKSYQITSKKTSDGSEATELVTVHRRFSDFEWIYAQLVEKYPCYIIPPLPEKNMLANYNQENLEFIEERKIRLTSFLNKILKRSYLRYAPEFIDFLLKNDTDFNRIVEQSNRKNSGLIASVSSIVDYMPSVPGFGYISGFISSFSGSQRVKRERTNLDDELEIYQKEVENLQGVVEQLATHIGLLAQVEREQANTMIDIGVQLTEMGKGQSMKASKLTIEAADKGSDVQKVHAKFLHNTLEREVEDTLNLIIGAKDALKRRIEIIEAVENGQVKLDDLKRSKANNAQIFELKALNDETKVKLELINEILPREIDDFKRAVTLEIEHIAKEFIKLQIEYSGKMVAIWSSK